MRQTALASVISVLAAGVAYAQATTRAPAAAARAASSVPTTPAASADGLAPERDPSVPVTSGFTPDPLRLAGRTAGSTPLSNRAAGCRGYVGGQPDQVVRLETEFAFLRFFVTAPSDVTLAVVGPDGRWRCAGRPLEGAPREQGAFAPGRYDVWIGSVRPDQQIAYELVVTEFRSVGPATGRVDESAPVGGGGAIGLETNPDAGRFRDRRLRRGFLPDPREDSGTAGGDIDIALLGGGCRGHVNARPNHVLELRDDFDYFRISVEQAPEGATLMVRTPQGRFLCSGANDDHAVVDQDAWAPGRYLIWVGSASRGEEPSYRIRYTEARAQR